MSDEQEPRRGRVATTIRDRPARLMTRCFDCFVDLGERRFQVLKKLRDMPPDADPAEARLLDGLLYDAVEICPDCAGWYGNHAIEVEHE